MGFDFMFRSNRSFFVRAQDSWYHRGSGKSVHGCAKGTAEMNEMNVPVGVTNFEKIRKNGYYYIPPKLAVADFMGYLKGKSTLMIFERHANLKYKYGRRVFWAKGYYVNTVGGNEAKIRKYIQEQEFNDQMCDQLSFKEYEDPFKNVADFDDDDLPEVPTDSMRK